MKKKLLLSLALLAIAGTEVSLQAYNGSDDCKGYKMEISHWKKEYNTLNDEYNKCRNHEPPYDD